MSNLPAIIQERGIDASTWGALKGQIYPDAGEATIALAIDYCKARGLDIMKKPVHIISYGGKDTIVPGISEYRTTATRTGNYAGIDRPEFVRDENGRLIECYVTVYRMIGGRKCAFVGYAAMAEMAKQTKTWKDMPSKMLAIRAESDALRKAFPEEIGSEPTAEELQSQPTIEPVKPQALTSLIADAEAADLEPSYIDANGQVFGVPEWNQFEMDFAHNLHESGSKLEVQAFMKQEKPALDWLAQHDPKRAERLRTIAQKSLSKFEVQP